MCSGQKLFIWMKKYIYQLVSLSSHKKKIGKFPRVRLAGRVRLGWPELSEKHCSLEQCFQPEQYFCLFFSPAEQTIYLAAEPGRLC